MSDLVKRLREQSRRGYWPLLGDEAADRIEALEAALRQAREALQAATNTAKAEGHAFRPWRHAAADSLATINDLLNDTKPSSQTAAKE